MPLVVTPDNPVPPGAIVESLRAVDGLRLRAAALDAVAAVCKKARSRCSWAAPNSLRSIS